MAIGPNRLLVLLVLVVVIPAILPIVLQTYGGSQSAPDRVRRYESHLKEVVPGADRFVSVDGLYPHFRGLVGGSGPNGGAVVGYAFFTTDLGGRSRGYAGVMKILVGLDAAGTLTGVKAVEHHEPYGYRSIDLPSYRMQFPGKRVVEPFKVGGDIDAVTGATITVVAATSAIRVATRRMARELITRRATGPQ
jgi:NosR/NirI family nitrous oxide reductase transcriptional regulator